MEVSRELKNPNKKTVCWDFFDSSSRIHWAILGHVEAMLGLCWTYVGPCWAVGGRVGAILCGQERCVHLSLSPRAQMNTPF